MRILLCTLLTLSFISFGSVRAADEKVETSPYYPLKVGSKWTYTANGKNFVSTVTKHEEFANEKCARVEAAGNVEHMLVKADGVYRVGFGGMPVDPPVKILQLPPAKGQTWDIKSKIGAEQIGGTIKIDMIDELKVPAGIYKDVVVSTGEFSASNQKISYTYYLAKDVGVIKMVVKIGDQDAVTIELEKFEPAK